MAWIKRNLIFVILVAIGLGLTGYCGYLLYSSLNSNSSVADDYNSTHDNLVSMYQKTPFPSQDNIQAAMADKERVQEFLADFRKSFAPFPKPPAEDQKGFKTYVEESIVRFRAEATNAGVQVSPDFGFTFNGLMGKLMVPPENIPPWMEQLQEINTILGVLYGAKVNALVNLCRVPVAADDVGTGDCMLPTTSTTNEWGVVTPYKVTFRGFSREIAAVLAGFARTSNCFIVQDVDVVADATGMPTVSSVTSDQPTMRQYIFQQPAPIMRMPGGGRERGAGIRGGMPYPYPTPAPTMPVAIPAPAAPAGPVTILTETPLLVTISVNAIKLKVSEH